MTTKEAVETKKPRVFIFEGDEYADPGAQYSNEDVRDLLARTFGALAGGIIKEDEQEERIVVNLKPRPEHKANGLAFSRERSCMACDGPLCALCGGCFEEGECSCYEQIMDDAMLLEWAQGQKQKLIEFANLCRSRPGEDVIELWCRVFELPATVGLIALD